MQQDKSAHFLPGIKNIVIDGFQFPLSIFPEQHQRHYFLTQYHQDHFKGLSPEWNQGHIYCSPITANALLNIMKFQTPSLVHSIEYNVPQILYDDIEFTFLDANHCPGSIMILFYCKSKNLYHLHTGMMKYSPSMKMYPALLQQQHQPQQLPPPPQQQQQQLQLQSLNTASPLPPLAPSSSSTPSNSSSSQHIKIDSLLLDTTYAHPKHNFASMEIILKKIIDMITDFLQKGSSSSSSSSNNNNGIVFISPYGLGKEIILKTILQECPDQCVHIPDEYYEFYELIPEYQPYYETNRIVRDRSMSLIHLVDQDFTHFTGSFFQPRFDRIHELIHVINEEKKMKYMNSTPELLTRALAILPSGWADTSNYQKVNPYQVKDQIHIQLLPFIEHSPYNDLVEFVKFIKPREVIPTVYADVSSLSLFPIDFLSI
jgi:DNA ligase-1